MLQVTKNSAQVLIVLFLSRDLDPSKLKNFLHGL